MGKRPKSTNATRICVNCPDVSSPRKRKTGHDNIDREGRSINEYGILSLKLTQLGLLLRELRQRQIISQEPIANACGECHT